jgi:hypothetical protein
MIDQAEIVLPSDDDDDDNDDDDNNNNNNNNNNLPIHWNVSKNNYEEAVTEISKNTISPL